MMIEEPLFDTLRTKEQLGYNVYYTLRLTFGVVGHSLSVNAQATKFKTEYVDQRIEAFIKSSRNMLKKIPERKFNRAKKNLIKTKLLTDVDLEEEVTRNWSEISSDEYVFDRLKKEVYYLETVKLKDIRQMWGEHHDEKKGKGRKLSIQVAGYDIKEEMETEVDVLPDPEECAIKKIEFLDMPEGKRKLPRDYLIKDLDKFKKQLNTYPLTTLTNKHWKQ